MLAHPSANPSQPQDTDLDDLMGPNEPDGTMYTCIGFYDPDGGIPNPNPTRFIHAKAIYTLAVGNRTVRGNNNASGDEDVTTLLTEFRGQSKGRPRYFGLCDVCFTEVPMSQNTLFHLRLHRGSQKCRKARAKRIKDGEKVRIETQLKEMREKNGTNGPRWMPATMPRSDTPHLSPPIIPVASLSSSSASYTPNSSPPQAGSSSTPALKYVPAAQWAYSSAYYVQCAGVPLRWASGSIYSTFPWAVFEDTDSKLGFPMVAVRAEEREIWVQATRCTSFRLPGQQECDPCRALKSLPSFCDLERRGQLLANSLRGELTSRNTSSGGSSTSGIVHCLPLLLLVELIRE
ncbi:hypothetical protein OF83DRAFT_87262 [Amylostereum chailletii]|nr:hypothetical protein OF83DRAFT_87262 [Amylostereum chailletii]